MLNEVSTSVSLDDKKGHDGYFRAAEEIHSSLSVRFYFCFIFRATSNFGIKRFRSRLLLVTAA